MAEVVGVVAAAAQLATASLSLLKMTRKIKGASKTLRNYDRNLQELHSLSCSISQNPLLQTPEIGACTDSILSVLEANSLASLIQKNRWHRTWAFISREQDLQDTFVILEQRKASLSLVIEHLQARALHEIQSDVRNMSRTPLPLTEAFNDAKHIEKHDQPSVKATQLQLAADPPVTTTTGVPLQQTPTQGAPENTTGKSSSSDAYHEELQRALDEAMKARDRVPGCDSMYYGCEAGCGSTQINGPSTIGNAADASKLAQNVHFDGNVTHVGPKKTGRGKQVNGRYLSVIGSLGDEEKLSMPRHHMTWVKALNDEDTIQMNGDVVETFDGEVSNAWKVQK